MPPKQPGRAVPTNPEKHESAFESVAVYSILVWSTLAFVCPSPAGRAAFGGAAFGGGRLRRRPALRAGDWAKLRKWLDSASDNYARSSSSSEQSENCVSKPFIFLSQKMTVLCCKNASFGPDQDQCFLLWFQWRSANARTCTGVVFGG